MSVGPNDIETPYLRELFRYWEEKRGGRAMPARRDLDPLDFTFALGHVLLLDVERDPLAFRFRLHGTALVQHAQYDMTGRTVDELPNLTNRAVLQGRCRDLIETRVPFVGRSERLLGGQLYGYEVVWLPLSDDGEAVSMLMGGMGYFDDPRRLNEPKPRQRVLEPAA